MLPSFEKLNDMLVNEKKQGYKNRLVIGGFESYAPNWLNEALKEATTKEQRLLIEEIAAALRNYRNVAEEERPDYVHQLRVKLHKGTSIDQPETAAESTPTAAVRSSAPRPANRPKTPRPKPARKPVSAVEGGRDGWKTLAYAGLDAPVSRLPGIKDATEKRLARLGVYTVGDFLTLYPRRYVDYRTLKPINRLEYGEEVTVIAQVWETRSRKPRSNLTIVTAVLSDGTGTIEASWFNQPWLEKKLKPGLQIAISGKVEVFAGRLTFQSPDWEEIDRELLHTGRIVPIYPQTTGITTHWLRRYIKGELLPYYAPRLKDHLPEDTRKRLGFFSLGDALRQIHYPDSWENLEAARRRLAFDELLMLQLGVLRQRQKWQSLQGVPVQVDDETVERFVQTLPFSLTQAQRRALTEIVHDLRRDTPMSRLLQGDVGSGKTVVALAAMVLTALNGGQSAILAPTEILAEQHFKGMSRLLPDISQALGREFTIGLLTGSTSAADRAQLLDNLANGRVDILVGTHALIQSTVRWKDLRLAVIDEQHRFGVHQRAALREKGNNPHMLVMTATPIPRTLALTMYGDLDLSIIDEMPPGRQPIATRLLYPNERERAYTFIQSQIEQGRQAYIIYPLVEESDKTEARAAIEEHKRLQHEVFPRLKLGLLHGRMKADEKETVMKAFRDHKIDILVSTSVVEVGIDVPNATVILIEGANRFGLAQLHQFRGRVGRGEHKSYCLLLPDKLTPEAEARLKVVESTLDGFKLAEEDLKLRGPGEFFGTRQSGMPDLKLVKLSDVRLLEMARQEANLILQQDPDLNQPQHRLLARRIDEFWQKESDLS